MDHTAELNSHCRRVVNYHRRWLEAKITTAETLSFRIVLNPSVVIILDTNATLTSLEMEEVLNPVHHTLSRIRTRISLLLRGNESICELKCQGRGQDESERTHSEYWKRRTRTQSLLNERCDVDGDGDNILVCEVIIGDYISQKHTYLVKSLVAMIWVVSCLAVAELAGRHDSDGTTRLLPCVQIALSMDVFHVTNGCPLHSPVIKGMEIDERFSKPLLARQPQEK